MGFLALASPHHRRYCTHSFTSSPALSNVNFTTIMFTFTKTSAICVLFALLGLKSVQGAPIDSSFLLYFSGVSFLFNDIQSQNLLR
jgi:hypothetical protein